MPQRPQTIPLGAATRGLVLRTDNCTAITLFFAALFFARDGEPVLSNDQFVPELDVFLEYIPVPKHRKQLAFSPPQVQAVLSTLNSKCLSIEPHQGLRAVRRFMLGTPNAKGNRRLAPGARQAGGRRKASVLTDMLVVTALPAHKLPGDSTTSTELPPLRETERMTDPPCISPPTRQTILVKT